LRFFRCQIEYFSIGEMNDLTFHPPLKNFRHLLYAVIMTVKANGIFFALHYKIDDLVVPEIMVIIQQCVKAVYHAFNSIAGLVNAPNVLFPGKLLKVGVGFSHFFTFNIGDRLKAKYKFIIVHIPKNNALNYIIAIYSKRNIHYFRSLKKRHLPYDSKNKVSYFSETSVKGIALPERFTFPFYYQPHPLAEIAADELKHYLETQTDLDHNFGIIAEAEGLVIGKMFGVLVVQDADGKLGYLSGFSGKLAGSNDHPGFVPPVFDMLEEDSFFLKEQYILNSINDRVAEMGSDENYQKLKREFKRLCDKADAELAALKAKLKNNKEERKRLREEERLLLNERHFARLEAYLVRHSLNDRHQSRMLSAYWKQKLDEVRLPLEAYDTEIESLKRERAEKSAALQQQLFEQYVFLNKDKKEKSLHDIFSPTVFGKPPAAAGECATPKLLQYAFLHGYEPLAMAEFWWGAPPKSEVRRHGQFYPACTGKCKPILAHMLEGMELDDDPFLLNRGEGKELEIVYEDDSFVVVNKPAELLSVPGIQVYDSVYARLKGMWGGIEPLIIHRLDMSTSGLLVVAKIKDVHEHIQKQFLKRTVTKRYTALLSKRIDGKEGEVSLPLRGDLDNRPRQLVCYEFGKPAVTKWKVVESNETTTKVHFWPLTGRTHQLRMHAAHELGLNAPIVGDDLYGTTAERLHLHAAFLKFTHPVTGEVVKFEVKEEF